MHADARFDRWIQAYIARQNVGDGRQGLEGVHLNIRSGRRRQERIKARVGADVQKAAFQVLQGLSHEFWIWPLVSRKAGASGQFDHVVEATHIVHFELGGYAC